jgi:cold shock CspA family protein
MKWQDGIVRWFDNRSGEGFVRVEGKIHYIHYSAIDREDENKPLDKNVYWRILFPGQKVKVQIYRDYHWTQIHRLKGVS